MLPMVLLKIVVHWLLSLCRAATKFFRVYGFFSRNKNNHHKACHQALSHNTTTFAAKFRSSSELPEPETLVFDFFDSILRSKSPFPFFMLVAFEGGSPLRASLLLLSCPLLFFTGFNSDLGLQIMTFVTFCLMRKKDMELVARAVLPKFYLEDLHRHSYELISSAKRKVALTRLPKAMVEGFLRDYLGISEVLGPELGVVRESFFTGLFLSSSPMATKLEEIFEGKKADVGIVNSFHQHHLLSSCKEVYVVGKEESSNGGESAVLPRDKYPKPLIFHDGRLAFLPTPTATLSLFFWLPFAVFLSLIRVLAGVVLPYKACLIIDSFSGVRLRVINPPKASLSGSHDEINNGVLYVCTHRTLLDPVMLSTAIARPVPAVTYSLSRTSELLAPMRTVRLTRDRRLDAEKMKKLLAAGDLVVCPEGTTCREPYLLRFSSLFAELSDVISPVAADARVGMFYGTTASGMKWLDPFFLMMNPRPEYSIEFMPRVPPEMTCGGGGLPAVDVANRIQRQLAGALGFECTGMSRREKYLMLAGNEGIVRS